MTNRGLCFALVAALATGACSDQDPMGVSESEFTRVEGVAASHTPTHTDGGLLSDIPVTGDITGGTFEGLLSITGLSFEDGQLLADGTLTGTATQLIDGATVVTEITQTFTDLALDLTSQGAGCRILLLEIPGGLELDLLGLVVDLAPVELEIRAERGPGNLLGNLLCAVTGLLDGGGALNAISNLLDRINDLLDPADGGLLSGIPVVGELTNGTFEGLLSITGLDFVDGQLVADGTLTGTVTQLIDGATVVTEITQAFTGEAIELTGNSCQILLLEIPGGLELDLLGLVVDLAPVELEVRGERGPGNLLGNLLCGLTGLLDGLGSLGAILDLLDRINDLL